MANDRRVPRAEAKHVFWTEAEKIRAITMWTEVGNWTTVSKMSGIPRDTLYSWTREPWFYDIKQRILEEQDEEIASKFGKIVKKAQEEVLDRLENGDFYLLKDGRTVRKAISAKEAAQIAATSVDKRNVLLGKPTSRTENVSTKDRLNRLAEEFKKFSKSKTIDAEVEVIPDAQAS